MAVVRVLRERRNANFLPKRCKECLCPGAGSCVLLESPSAPPMELGGRGRLGGRGGAPGHLAAVGAAQPLSQLLDLLSNNDGVLLTDLLGSFCLVVVGTGMHVRVPVNGTEQVPTAAVEAS